MELLIALLTFFNVSFGVNQNQVKLGWSQDKAAQIQRSNEYNAYLDKGGVDLFDAEGIPAINVTVDKDVKK